MLLLLRTRFPIVPLSFSLADLTVKDNPKKEWCLWWTEGFSMLDHGLPRVCSCNYSYKLDRRVYPILLAESATNCIINVPQLYTVVNMVVATYIINMAS